MASAMSRVGMRTGTSTTDPDMSRHRLPNPKGERFRATLRHYHIPKLQRSSRGTSSLQLFQRRFSLVIRILGLLLLIGLLVAILVALFVEMST